MPQEGHFDYQGRWTQQHTSVFSALIDLIDLEESLRGAFDVIIEIGTGAGGLAKWLGNTFPGKAIHTFDLDAPETAIGLSNVTQHIGNCDTATNAALVALIEGASRCLVLCDGGNKLQELTRYAPPLRAVADDVIAAHDCVESGFGTDWAWNEFHISQVPYLSGLGTRLERIHDTLLRAVGWVAYRRTPDVQV